MDYNILLFSNTWFIHVPRRWKVTFVIITNVAGCVCVCVCVYMYVCVCICEVALTVFSVQSGPAAAVCYVLSRWYLYRRESHSNVT
jgi:hypothetical protein